jgi:hypothetical protein
MGTPIIKGTAGNIRMELISAMSALNMPPEPIENPDGEYLSELDGMAQHSMAHISAAFRSFDEMRRGARNVLIRVLKELVEDELITINKDITVEMLAYFLDKLFTEE